MPALSQQVNLPPGVSAGLRRMSAVSWRAGSCATVALCTCHQADRLGCGGLDCAWRGAVVFADAVSGVEAAQRSGCPPVGVTEQAHGGGYEQHPHEGGVEN